MRVQLSSVGDRSVLYIRYREIGEKLPRLGFVTGALDKLKILVFGNTLLRNDRMPIILMDALQKEFRDIEFREFDAVEDLHKEGSSLYILDTVEGIEQVITITEIDQLKTNMIYSVHDFDLAYNLRLLKKVGMIEKVLIFGIPMTMKKRQALKELKKIIRSTLLLKND